MAFAPDYRSDGWYLLTVFSQPKGRTDTLPRSAAALSSKDLQYEGHTRCDECTPIDYVHGNLFGTPLCACDTYGALCAGLGCL